MANSAQHEPTMEEILASIRKIISEDSAESPAEPVEAVQPAQVVPVATVLPAPAAEADDDVMELTEEIREPAKVHEPAPVAVAPVAAAPEILEPPKPAEVVPPKPAEEPVMPKADSSEFFSDKTRKAIGESFSNVESAVQPPKPKPAVPVAVANGPEGATVEAVFERAVRDAVGPHIDQWMEAQKGDILVAMRPLIRDWMDENFPALLETAVRDEIARVVKARGN